MVEGYPVDPKKNPLPDVFAWTGIASAFRKAGFKEVACRSLFRPVMRFEAARGEEEMRVRNGEGTPPNLVNDLRYWAMPYTCPHRRPTLIEMNYRELEKKFGRLT